jgi:hypothetical protein
LKLQFYSGIKLGLIHRGPTYPLFGIESGIEVEVLNGISLGLRASYDVREDMDSKIIGDIIHRGT